MNMKTSKANHCHAAKLKVGFLMKTILLLCLTQHCVSFGLAGSEIRSNRAPITCFPAESRKPSSSLSSSLSNNSSSSSSVEKDTSADGKTDNNVQLEQNTKYVKGLIDTLDGLLEKWAVTGNMGTVRSYMLY